MAGIEGASPIIAIVEDDDSMRRAAENLVRSLGYVSRSFISAEDFLGSADRKGVSCILVDVQLPRMSGLNLLSHLTREFDPTPVVVMTAFQSPDVEKHAMDGGACCFLKKPFAASEFARCIGIALQKCI
jgi:FixJ family two-component response regulator